MKREIVDFHCDVLSRLQCEQELDFAKDDRLDVTAAKLRAGGVKLQVFAIYISERLGPARFTHILEQIDLFHREVKSQGISLITTVEELNQLLVSGRTGALLSIEGADGLEGNLANLRLSYELGVRALGLTWNYANWAADGVLEPRNGGFTIKGRELIAECMELGTILDVSHLSSKAFWELAEISEQAERTFIASHSNSYRICPHPRNLTDEQIRTIIRLGGRIGINFYPHFVKSQGPVSAEDLLPHIDHLCSLGAENHIMFGSDFDGIGIHLTDLENASQYPIWTEKLLERYPEPLVQGWLSGNAISFLKTQLPQGKKTL